MPEEKSECGLFSMRGSPLQPACVQTPHSLGLAQRGPH